MRRGEDSRTGQVTMFVLLGIVLLLITGVLYLVASEQSARRAGEQNSKDVSARLDVALIDSHVGSCLNTIVRDEVTLIGDSGGLLPTSPSGIVGVGDAQRRVAYAITRPRGERFPIVYPPPQYPDDGVWINNDTIIPQTGRAMPLTADGYFGDTHFPAACDINGANHPGSPISCPTYPGIPPGTSGPSVQESLERNIAQRVGACASAEVFKEAIGRDVLRVGAPRVNISYLPNAFIVSLTYPIELAGDISLTTPPITRSYDVRLLSVVAFATDLARTETRNLTFSPQVHYRDVPSWKPGMTVLLSNNIPVASPMIGANEVSLDNTADMVVIIDAGSLLGGTAFATRYLIESRAPVLAPFSPTQWRDFFVSREDEQNASTIVAYDPDTGSIRLDDARITFRVSGPNLRVIAWDDICSAPYDANTCPVADTAEA